MKNPCVCGRNNINIAPYSALLLQQFFRLIVEKHPLFLLCEQCGSEILSKYRDTYGIGV